MAGTEDVRQYVIFRLGPEEYGLPIAKVSSIIRYEPATPVPRSPEIVDGVINLRGRVIPVVNLAKKLFDTDFHPSSSSRIIVAEGEAGLVGLAVDAASEVVSIAVADILDPPETALTAETAEVFEGVARCEDRLIILLDLDKALPRGDYDSSASGEITEGDEDV
ncbi:MAG: chemotaxis protein CheW [Coriobacteriia bacterium]|nr:chemotaxis protein CheW [Coriobacteriia bacterium]